VNFTGTLLDWLLSSSQGSLKDQAGWDILTPAT
jgi:hypothetical protein